LVRRWKFEQGERLADSVEQLDEQLARVRQQGYGVRHYRDGIVSVRVPIGISPLAAFAVSRPQLSPGSLPPLIERLRGTAEAIRTSTQP
jgi:hypothetical protein